MLAKQTARLIERRLQDGLSEAFQNTRARLASVITESVRLPVNNQSEQVLMISLPKQTEKHDRAIAIRHGQDSSLRPHHAQSDRLLSSTLSGSFWYSAVPRLQGLKGV